MYTPTSFVEKDLTKLHDLIEAHSFGLLVSHHEGEPTATHLPLLLDRDETDHGRLVGHMARANPQWKTAADQRVLVIFSGPHTYISPSWYGAGNVVPTWNYVAVHAYGTLRLEEDRAALHDLVRRYVDTYEAGMASPWSLDQAQPQFIERLLDAIVGFAIDVDRLEGKWKLNQNHDRRRRDHVVAALRSKGGADQLQIAELMEAVDNDPKIAPPPTR